MADEGEGVADIGFEEWSEPPEGNLEPSTSSSTLFKSVAVVPREVSAGAFPFWPKTRGGK